MSKSSSRESTSHSRRKSLFTLSSLTQINPTPRPQPANSTPSPDSAHSLRKRRTEPLPTVFSSPSHSDLASDDARSPQASPAKSRPSLSIRPSLHRPSSTVFGTLRSSRSTADDDTPLTAGSSKAPSVSWPDVDVVAAHGKPVIHHGEVQTSSGMFRKKKEYLVLTDTHIVRCKNQAKAADVFAAVPPPFGRSPTIRHSSTHSVSSTHDLQSLASDSSGDKEGRISLRQIVAVHRLDDGKPYFAMEVDYLDEDSGQAAAMILQFSNPDERDLWIKAVRSVANDIRLREPISVSAHNSNYAARVVEREHDYDPNSLAIYKVVQKSASKSASRSSTDDLSKMASNVCFLAIGIHKVHLIPLEKQSSRASSPSLTHVASHATHGVLTLTSFRMSPLDDSIEVTFRQPLKRPRTLLLASLAAEDIAIRLHYIENILRPECGTRLFRFLVPPEVEDRLLPPVSSDEEEHCCLDRTLTAYCLAFDINPANIRYTINYACEDAPRFELLPAADPRRREYSSLELLAVMRALRYNESFTSLSFANVSLDRLNGLHDNYGSEYVCSMTKLGTAMRLSPEELAQSCLLVQEIRALAATSKRLRRMDFSYCITTKPSNAVDDGDVSNARDPGSGIVEALFPLCKHQTTNVDWIALNGITLSDTDLDYLVASAVDRACHFRALELSRCGLTDRTLGLTLDALRAQDNTLEALDISGNLARLSPAIFDSQISIFGFIRKLNLSYLARTSGTDPIIHADTLLTWRLEELRLSGTTMNEKTVDALAIYLESPQSDTLHELFLDHTYMTGSDVASLMQAMNHGYPPGQPRNLHLDISHNQITKDHDYLTRAIAADQSPTHLTLRAIEYRDEGLFRSLINSISKNHSTQYLDMSRASLPSDVSEETSQALERMFAENNTLEELDISGEDSRLETCKFGVGLNRALSGLKQNTRLHILRIQYQRLGLPGGTTIADVLRENATLREVHCEHNDIPLAALTDMINALGKNTTLVYLPPMSEGRAIALKQTERQVKQIRDEAPLSPRSPSSPVSKPSSTSSFGMRRSLANVKRNVNRTASAYTPSFPSLPQMGSSGRSTSSPMTTSAAFTFSPPQASSSVSPKSKLNHLSPVAASSSSATQHSATVPLPQLSDQDIQAALRLVAEAWDRQQWRLQQYLHRNWCLLQGIPGTAMEIEEEDFERTTSTSSAAAAAAAATAVAAAASGAAVGSVTSLAKVLEAVRFESTPTAEKELDFEAMADALVPRAANAKYAPASTSGDASADASIGVPGDDVHAFASSPANHLQLHLPPQHGFGLQSFLLSDEHTPEPENRRGDGEVDADEDAGLAFGAAGRVAGLGLGIHALAPHASASASLGQRPRTPTQQGFFET